MANALNLDNGGELFNIFLESDGDLSFRANNRNGAGDARVTIKDDSGDVGIGTGSPAERLHVIGNRIRLQNGTKQFDMRADGAQVDLQTSTNDLYIRSTGAGHDIVINPQSADGNVGIGGPQSPNATLQVRGELGLESSTGTELWNMNVNSSGNLTFNSNNVVGGTTRMTINDDNGNVTIGGALSQNSSIALKENVVTLSAKEAFKILDNLNPVKFIYKNDKNKETHTGFIAEESPKMVTSEDGKSICVTDVIGILTKIIKKQQESINTLTQKMKELSPK